MSNPHYNGNDHTKEENDNHANQLNPNNDAYASSRGQNDDDDGKEDRDERNTSSGDRV